MRNLDTRTLEAVFQSLVNDNEKEAALTVASMAFGSTNTSPEEWLENNYDGNENKIQVIKELRDEFDLGLKDAKAKVDEYEDVLDSEEIEFEPVSDIMDVAYRGLTVRINGEEDEITKMDPDSPSLKIETEKRGWITPFNQEWEVPRGIA